MPPSSWPDNWSDVDPSTYQEMSHMDISDDPAPFFVGGHLYRWIGPIHGHMPNGSEAMEAFMDGNDRLCISSHATHCHDLPSTHTQHYAVQFENIDGAWYWNHLIPCLQDLTVQRRNDMPSSPSPHLFKKGDIIKVRNMTVVIMDNRHQARTRLVLINGQSARIETSLLRRI